MYRCDILRCFLFFGLLLQIELSRRLCAHEHQASASYSFSYWKEEEDLYSPQSRDGLTSSTCWACYCLLSTSIPHAYSILS